MGDFGEFRQHWRPLLASFLGMGSALALNSFILSTFAPYILEDFGWSRAQWAALGTIQMLIMVSLPIAGRLTDLFGVRRVAAVGALSYPVFLVLIATMSGDIRVYAAIYVAQTLICSTTTSTVYSRVVAAVFKVRRGLALGIAGSAPPFVAMIGSPLITAFVEQHGWRTGYLLVAVFCTVCAVLTLLLLQPHNPAAMGAPVRRRPSAAVYREIFRMPVFWLLLIASFLTNIPYTVATSQIKMVALEQGLTDATAALLVSAFAFGSIVGRMVAGIALDYFPGYLVATVNYLLPFAGLLLLASPIDSPAVVIFSLLLVGLSFGGEGDIIPYVVTRYFRMGVFSTVLGMISAALGSAIGMGNAVLAVVLSLTGSFNGYLLAAAATTFIGSVMFFMLGLKRFQTDVSEPAAAP